MQKTKRVARRVKCREVTDEFGRLKHYILNTHRNSALEVIVDPSRPDLIDITKRPARLTEEDSRCLVAILQHVHNKLLKEYGVGRDAEGRY